VVGGVGGFLEGGSGVVVARMIYKRWRGMCRVIVRERVRIGNVLEVGEGRKIEVWNIYVGEGKHRSFGWGEGDGNKVVMGDMNGHHGRWGRDEEIENVDGRRISRWMDEEGWILDTPREVVTRRPMRRVGKERVLDMRLWTGGLEVEGRI